MHTEAPPITLKNWRERVRSLGSIIDHDSQVVIHHIAGRTARQDGYQVGHLLILPLTPRQHEWIDMGAAGLDELKMHYEVANMQLFDAEIEAMSLHTFEMFLWSQMVKRAPPDGWDEELHAARQWRRA